MVVITNKDWFSAGVMLGLSCGVLLSALLIIITRGIAEVYYKWKCDLIIEINKKKR